VRASAGPDDEQRFACQRPRATLLNLGLKCGNLARGNNALAMLSQPADA